MESLSYAYSLAAISTICWGAIVIPIKLARVSGRLGIGISMATGALAMALIAGREMAGALSLPPSDLLRFVAAGTFQFTLGCMFYYESIRRGSVSIAVPVTRVKVIFVLFLSIGLGLEAFRWSLLGACVLVVMGGIAISLRPSSAEKRKADDGHRLSVLLAVLSCLCWAIGETIIGTFPESVGSVAANGLMLWAGLLTYGLYAAVSGAWREFRSIPRRDILCYVSHGIISFSIAYVTFVKAIAIAGPPRISCITSTYPLISAFIGWVAFKERLAVNVVIGALLLVGGVILLQLAG